jgi:hypothetical protein
MSLPYHLGFMVGPISGSALSWYQSQTVSEFKPWPGHISAAHSNSQLTVLAQTSGPTGPVCGWALTDRQEWEC